MDLLHQEHINKIENCPLDGQKGELTLFRWVHKDKFVESFVPNGVRPKHANNCLAWGLSTFNSKDSAIQELNNLSKNIRKKYNAIALCKIKDEDGIKHQSGNKKHHYTFYPKSSFDLITNFQIIEDEN
ncbi:hypothetical protein AB1278_03780 [Chryseobacterium sp. NRRL B-14798]|uniref:hypothetical protein n=1 Tax=Chryseobacterium sp. NRRL B-14798 TaxID=3162880 RepID=UPI003D1E7767